MAIFKMLKFAVFLVIVSIAVRSEGLNPRKFDDVTPPDLQNKCGNCPCNNPCDQAPPPPSPPPPPPPSPPPPPKIKPPSYYCPPPPCGGCGQYPLNPPYVYINGPPGNLYAVNPYYSGASRSFSLRLPLFISTILRILAFI